MSLVEQVTLRDLPDDFSMLEIGVGSSPFSPEPTVLADTFYVPNPNFDFSGDRRYLGVDNGSAVGDHSYLGTPEQIDLKAHAALSRCEELMRKERPGQNIDLIFEDVLKLGLSGESFSEVIMNNVLSSMIEVERVRELIRLSAMVLKVEGLLVTRETFTPRFMPAEKVAEEIAVAGFSEVEVIAHASEADQYDALKDYYGPTIHDWPVRGSNISPHKYFCLATK